MFYFVTKTGLPMFDACRAYGLALILDRLSAETGAMAQVRIGDLGPFYQLEAPNMATLLSVKLASVFDDLLTVSSGWCGALLTTARSPNINRVKPKSRKKLEDEIGEVRRTLEGLSDWLSALGQPIPCELRASRAKGFQTLPSSLDVSAAKGIRRPKLDGYSEGEQIYVPEEQWAVALLGGANFIRWTWAGGNYAGLLPAPQSLTLRNHQDIRDIADSGYLCGVSTTTAAGHYAVRLAEALRQRRASQTVVGDRYATLIVQAMSFAGNQWKAMSGGLFPLELPMRLVDSDLNISDYVFGLWDSLFRCWGSVRGNEPLAVMLADFLAQPSLETFEHYARTHLRMTLADERRRQYSPYQIEWMKEVLSHVG